MGKVKELTQIVSQCLKDEQDIKALHDAIRDMEPDEAEIMLADYLQRVKDPDFWERMDTKAKISRALSQWDWRLR